MISSFPFFSQFEYYSSPKAGKLPGWEATRLGSNNVADMLAVEKPIQKDGDGGVGILESDNNSNNNNNNNNNNNIIMMMLMTMMMMMMINFIYVSGCLADKLTGDTTKTNTEIKCLRL